jgi:predicted small lipoprotein YifL
MKKAILIVLTACLICACGQKGPLVPPEVMLLEANMPGITDIFSS